MQEVPVNYTDLSELRTALDERRGFELRDTDGAVVSFVPDGDLCRTPGCPETTGDGEGYNGYCGDCADRLEREGRWA